MMEEILDGADDVPASEQCCSALERCRPVNTLHPAYRLIHSPQIESTRVPVEVTLHFTLTRTVGDTMLGPVVHSISLLPRETVRLHITDRASSWSFDTSNELAYRSVQASSESYYNAGMASAFSSLSSVSSGRSSSTHHDDSVSGGGNAGLDLGIFEIGGSVAGSSHNSSSTSAFLNSLTQTSRAQSSHVEHGTRSAFSLSVGTVASRSHSTGTGQDHFEAATHTLINENRFHTVNHRFHQLVEEHTAVLTLDAVTMRIINRDADSSAVPSVPRPLTGVGLYPQKVSTISQNLEATEAAGRRAAVARTAISPGQVTEAPGRSASSADPAIEAQALALVRTDLQRAGIIGENGDVTAEAKTLYGWRHVLCLPTPGWHVLSCLSSCDIGEDELHRRDKAETEQLELENDLLRRQAELMDTDQEHRCCPGNTPTETTGT
ncbi:hypothetical protein [Streptomyces lavendulae]|uniref:hypothetical protein n=1 Tax=Streptomyces lavendulae TaxID=1914 RepID=UPI0034044112